MLLLNDDCIYVHPDTLEEMPAKVTWVRDNNRFDLVVETYALEPHQRATHQMIKLGTGPGECHPEGWEPTLAYVSPSAIQTTADLAADIVAPPKRRRSIPRWAYPGIFAAGAWFGQLIAYAYEVLSR